MSHEPELRWNEWIVAVLPGIDLPEVLYPTRGLRFHFTGNQPDDTAYLIGRSYRLPVDRWLERHHVWLARHGVRIYT